MGLNTKLRAWFGFIVGESESKTTQNLYYLFLTAIIVIAVVLLLVLFIMLRNCTFPPSNAPSCSYGEIGDAFGGFLNPILTFLAFMGLLITIAVQKNELSQTRKQLTNTAKAQEDIARLQKIELMNASMYRLLEALRDTARGITLHKKHQSTSFPDQRYTESGSHATMQILAKCTEECNRDRSTSAIDKARAASDAQYDYISSHMSSYFEQLRYILFWIEQTSDGKKTNRELLVVNMFYQDIYLAYIFAQNSQQEELLHALNSANLISFIPDHDTIFDEAFRAS